MKNTTYILFCILFFISCKPTPFTKFPEIPSDLIVRIDGLMIANVIHFQAIGSIPDEGESVQEFGHCWSFSKESPDIDDEHTTFTTGNIDNFTSPIQNFNLSEKVYVRAYAKNVDDRIFYSKILSISLNTDDVPKWKKVGSYNEEASNPSPRIGAIAFSDESTKKIYYGMGQDRQGTPLNDFWMYDPVVNEWTRLENFLGLPRWAATGFKIENKIYIGSGDTGNGFAADFYQFDISTLKWIDDDETLNQFPGKARKHATGFALNGKGFIGFGCVDSLCSKGYFSDSVFRFQPGTGWSSISCNGCKKRQNTVAAVVNNKAYLFFGVDSLESQPPFVLNTNIDTYDETTGWEIDASSLQQARGRVAAVLFVINDEIYGGFGQEQEILLNDFYRFNFNWVNSIMTSNENDFPGKLTFSAGVGLGKVGFIIGGTRKSGEFTYEDATNEVWLFIPN